jgi:hypothetical protein
LANALRHKKSPHMRGGAWRRVSGQARALSETPASSGKERQMKGSNNKHHKRDTAAQILNEHGATGFAMQG